MNEQPLNISGKHLAQGINQPILIGRRNLMLPTKIKTNSWKIRKSY
jgi:hypothetical protein